MARPANHQRDEAIAALRELTAQHGAKEGARLAREQFAHVPAGTWGRWRQMAVGNAADADAQALNSLAAEVRRSIPPPKALTAGAVTGVRRALDFWNELDSLLADADLLRSYALAAGADGRIKVRVPRALVDSANMRRDLLKLALAQAETAWSVERAQTFFDAVIAEVGAESVECQHRIVARLRKKLPPGSIETVRGLGHRLVPVSAQHPA